MRTEASEWQKNKIIIVAHTACALYSSLISQMQNYAILWTVYHCVWIIEFKNQVSPIQMNGIDWFCQLNQLI